ncbi:LapA family protein [Streptomyces longwoodensis]|uniref:LapA family protein n=1 Tax=Streptomyces lasalocidi TaxID=324833 RepID=A0A4V6AWH0_STRLS|nr:MULTISPECIES: LapA family protein [Streptomyces]MCX4996874.1 LapA family protein [Streptomyces longwoodensis]TKT03793.1 LapA family protein [Streptomyces lasalocidi]WRY91536.1 LapA family protein [Streptomyces longwoodensis]WUC56962.1 LapA family protein [Streptomyces longwoodensis]WUC70471.1 LapA family protein [Streptomyces longwoodensis]
MSTKTSERRTGESRTRALSPARIAVLVLAVLGLVFIFENTADTEIRLLVPVVTMPLWVALLATGLIGALCGSYLTLARRRR